MYDCSLFIQPTIYRHEAPVLLLRKWFTCVAEHPRHIQHISLQKACGYYREVHCL